MGGLFDQQFSLSTAGIACGLLYAALAEPMLAMKGGDRSASSPCDPPSGEDIVFNMFKVR